MSAHAVVTPFLRSRETSFFDVSKPFESHSFTSSAVCWPGEARDHDCCRVKVQLPRVLCESVDVYSASDSQPGKLDTIAQVVQEAVASCVEAVLAECHSPAVLRAATVTLVGSKKGQLKSLGKKPNEGKLRWMRWQRGSYVVSFTKRSPIPRRSWGGEGGVSLPLETRGE